MEIRQHCANGAGWFEGDANTVPQDNAALKWIEALFLSPGDADDVAHCIRMETELIRYFIGTNTSFITTESDALLQLATRTVRLEDNVLRYSGLLISLAPDEIITAETGDSGLGASVRQRWNVEQDDIHAGPWYVLALLLDEFADSYLPVMESVEDKALAMEEHLSEAPLTPEQLSELFRMRRELILLQRIIDPVSNLADRLAQAEQLPATEAPPNFRPARDELHRLQNRMDVTWQVVTSVVEMSNLLEQQRQGSANRKLSAWAAIIGVPTAMAGILGMNFPHMPGMNTPYGPWVALGTMGIVCTVLILRFRKIKWL